MADSTVTITYAAPSAASSGEQGTDVRLSTPVEPGTSSLLFDGFLTHGEISAAALLLVARVARTRFYVPPGMLAAILVNADPVVTASSDRLRFESFSACCGVAARYDILAGGLDRVPSSHGTTNVDLNPPVRAALAEVRGLDPLHLSIGTEVTFTTMDRQITEHKVPLPSRWVRGFAEAQASSAGLKVRAVLNPHQALRFLRTLPVTSNGRDVLQAVPGRDGLRLTTAATGASVPLGGPSRLRVIEPLLPYATSVIAYAAAPESVATGVSVWQVDLPDARFVLTLSPAATRGFSGEGGLLDALADARASADADDLRDLLRFESLVDVARLGQTAGMSALRVERGLAHLAAAGQVGYDAAEQSYYHRDLPWSRDTVESMHPRLVDARALVAAGAVTTRSDGGEVLSNQTRHIVRTHGAETTCTCTWFAQYRQSRGPCKHILALSLVTA